MQKVAVIYHFFPHYRSGIIKELLKSNEYEFHFLVIIYNNIKASNVIKIYLKIDSMSLNLIIIKDLFFNMA